MIEHAPSEHELLAIAYEQPEMAPRVAKALRLLPGYEKTPVAEIYARAVERGLDHTYLFCDLEPIGPAAVAMALSYYPKDGRIVEALAAHYVLDVDGSRDVARQLVDQIVVQVKERGADA